MYMDAIFTGSNSFTGKENKQYYILTFASPEIGTYSFFVGSDLFNDVVSTIGFGSPVELELKPRVSNNNLVFGLASVH